jgi:spoIIIJ-associated protein
VEPLQSVEAIGASIEEAIGRGLDALNATRDQVSVDVIDPGGGKTMARVRVTLLPQPEAEARPPDVAPLAPAPPVAPATGDEIDAAREVLLELLRQMRVKAQVEARQGTAEDERDLSAPGGPPLVLNIKGDDLGILIGRRGETLRDLQYVARLIVGKRLGRNLNLIVDVEGYKNRREQTLRQLATRMAERVVATHKSIELEPMPANERRIIHLALRNHPEVTTQSVGQGDERKVTLIPKSRRS